MARTKEERYIRKCMEWIARHKAQLDQHQKQFEDQYVSLSPRANRWRLEDLEARRFEIEIHEYELGGVIKSYLDKYPEGK